MELTHPSFHIEITRNNLDRLDKPLFGAYHGFDRKGVNRWVQGVTGLHRLLYNEEAGDDAIVRVKNFLEKYLK